MGNGVCVEVLLENIWQQSSDVKLCIRHLASLASCPMCSSRDVSFMMSASFAFILLSMLRAREAIWILRNSRRCLLVLSLLILSLISSSVGWSFLTGPLFCAQGKKRGQSRHTSTLQLCQDRAGTHVDSGLGDGARNLVIALVFDFNVGVAHGVVGIIRNGCGGGGGGGCNGFLVLFGHLVANRALFRCTVGGVFFLTAFARQCAITSDFAGVFRDAVVVFRTVCPRKEGFFTVLQGLGRSPRNTTKKSERPEI